MSGNSWNGKGAQHRGRERMTTGSDDTNATGARRGRIAFQGELGANSHAACLQARPEYEPLPCPTFEDVFAAVERGEAELAIIPVENNLAGRVADIHHLLPESRLHIVGEHFLPIHHHLMAPPGASIEGLREVHSHVHALGQCRKLIRELRLSARVAADTAGAAREVAERGEPTVAAIAPKLAAEIHGLEILRENVEDEDYNVTRFLVMAREPLDIPPDDGPVITSFIFQVRNVPAALYKALGGFATNGVNMTRLESHQIGGNLLATQFHADIEGHPEDRPVRLALEELKFFSNEVRILGTYPASPMRAKVMERAGRERVD